jgi:hypothetical protein
MRIYLLILLLDIVSQIYNTDLQPLIYRHSRATCIHSVHVAVSINSLVLLDL